MKVIYCECGWQTMHRKGEPPPAACEACDKPGTLEEVARDNWSATIMPITDLHSQRVAEACKDTNLSLLQLSTNVWAVLRLDGYQTLRFKDDECRALPKLTVQLKGAKSVVHHHLRKHGVKIPLYLTK